MRFLLTALLTLSFHLLLAQESKIEGLKETLEKQVHDTIKFDACMDLHNYYFKTDTAQTLFYTNKALQLAQGIDKPRYYVYAYQMLARYERKQRRYKKVLSYDFKILYYVRQLKNEPMIFQTTVAIATDYLDSENHKEALKWLKQAEALNETSTDLARIASLNQKFAYYYLITDQHVKAIPYFDKTISGYEKIGNFYKAAESKIFLVESMIKIGKTTNAARFLFEAAEAFKTNNNSSRLADTYKLLGVVFTSNGDAEKGLEYLGQAVSLQHGANNFTEEGLAHVEMVKALLAQKKFALAGEHAETARQRFEQNEYTEGMVMVHTLEGQIASETGALEKADEHFIAARALLKGTTYPELQLDNDRQWAIHKYRQNKLKEADSLTYSYASHIAKNKSPESIAAEIAMMKKRNTGIDSNMVNLLAVLYAPGGAEKIKASLNDKNLSSLPGFDSLLKLNPYTKATPAFDSGMTVAYNKQFQELETRFRTRIIADSLKSEVQSNVIARQSLQNRNYLLTGAAIIAVLVAVFAFAQFKSRKRAERDKDQIRLLQNEIHHRVKNNLAVINRLVEVAGKNSVDEVPLSALKNRIKSIELLHKHLYDDRLKAGNIFLQHYLEDLSVTIAATFEAVQHVAISVDANHEVKSDIAEKLGLIVNELVTNSYKYAFGDGGRGNIQIRVSRQAENVLELQVKDNGRGFDAAVKHGSYGMKLIRGLSNQLDGKFSFGNENGTIFKLSINI